MSRRDGRQRDAGSLVYGGVPRVDLMPPEVAIRRREAGVRNSLIAGVVVVVLLVAGGVAASVWFAAQAEDRLAAERQLTEELLATQLQYSEVRSVQSQINQIVQQRDELLTVDLLWRDEIAPYLAPLGGATVDAISVSSNAPFSTPLGLDGPLRAPRVATVSFSVSTDGVPEAAAWLRAFALVETYSDASIDTVVAEDGGYLSTITLNLNELALSERLITDEGDGS